MNTYFIGTALASASLYMVSATGNAICMKSGNINLGSEGQIYAGGFITAILLNFFASHNFTSVFTSSIALSTALIFSIIVSALISSTSALLQQYRKASFLLTSFIVAAFIIPLIDGLITSPFRSKTANLIATDFIIEKYRFPQILEPSTLSPFIFFAVGLCILGGFFIYKSNYGQKINIYGIAPDFSKYAGFSTGQIELTSAIISGAMNGLTGFAAICGLYYSCHQGFYNGIGWNALSVAMIARLNPFFIIPVSVFLAFTITFADNFALFHNFDFDISGMIQGLIIFVIAITEKIGRKK